MAKSHGCPDGTGEQRAICRSLGEKEDVIFSLLAVKHRIARKVIEHGENFNPRLSRHSGKGASYQTRKRIGTVFDISILL